MVSVLILAAGQGTRMKSALPKVLHPVGGKPMMHHVIDAALSLNPENCSVVVSPNLIAHRPTSGYSVSLAVQDKTLGTGDAVRVGLSALTQASEDILILCGDTPLISTADLTLLLAARTQHPNDIIVGAFQAPQPNTYGRLKTDSHGRIERIIESKDATPEELKISLCNSGVILIQKTHLEELLPLLTTKNAQQEYYLTDIIGKHIPARSVEVPLQNFQGINDRFDLLVAEETLQKRWRYQALINGVTLLDFDSVFFSHDTVLGQDVVIEPNVVFGAGVTVGNNVRILSHCRISNTTIQDGCEIGPFAHLRDGNKIASNVAIGNFVEVKGSTIGAGTKAKHLSYLGNAQIGLGVNIGAGTITCNHNGFVKSATMIGDGAYIGSDTCLVAPVTVGAGAIVAAGSIINEDVPENALAIAREHQVNKKNWASTFRARQKQGE